VADNAANLRELALRLKREAILVRCGGRTGKYQRDGEFGSFPADDVLALAEFVLEQTA